MSEQNRQNVAKINRITSVNLTSSFTPTGAEPDTKNGTIFDVLLKMDKLLVKQSHTDLARKRSRYDISDQNGFPLLRGFQRSRRLSILPDPIRVYNTGLQTPLLEVKFEFIVARFKNADVFASNNVAIGNIKRCIEVKGFVLHNLRDGYVFNVQKEPTESTAEIKFGVCSQKNKSEVATIVGKSQIDYTLKLNDNHHNTPNTKALLLGFILYYDTMRR